MDEAAARVKIEAEMKIEIVLGTHRARVSGVRNASPRQPAQTLIQRNSHLAATKLGHSTSQ